MQPSKTGLVKPHTHIWIAVAIAMLAMGNGFTLYVQQQDRQRQIDAQARADMASCRIRNANDLRVTSALRGNGEMLKALIDEAAKTPRPDLTPTQIIEGVARLRDIIDKNTEKLVAEIRPVDCSNFIRARGARPASITLPAERPTKLRQRLSELAVSAGNSIKEFFTSGVEGPAPVPSIAMPGQPGRQEAALAPSPGSSGARPGQARPPTSPGGQPDQVSPDQVEETPEPEPSPEAGTRCEGTVNICDIRVIETGDITVIELLENGQVVRIEIGDDVVSVIGEDFIGQFCLPGANCQ